MKCILTIVIILSLVSCSNNAKYHLDKFIYYSENKDYYKALEHINSAIDKNPNNYIYYMKRTQAITNLDNDLEKIIADLDKCLELNNNYDPARYIKAQAFWRSNRLEEAFEEYVFLSAKYPDNKKLKLEKGVIAFQAKKLKFASEELWSILSEGEMDYNLARTAYYHMIYAKHFDDSLTATWDVAFLEDRGFEKDTILENLIYNNKLIFEDCILQPFGTITPESLEWTF